MSMAFMYHPLYPKCADEAANIKIEANLANGCFTVVRPGGVRGKATKTRLGAG
jgi:hypothetical protein